MTKFFTLLLFCCLIVSCTDDDDSVTPACDVSHPIRDLAWLRVEVERRNASTNEEMKYCYIVQASLNGQDVFVYEDCNPFIDKAIAIYNCEGTLINTLNNPIGIDDLQNKTIIWKRHDFVCEIQF